MQQRSLAMLCGLALAGCAGGEPLAAGTTPAERPAMCEQDESTVVAAVDTVSTDTIAVCALPLEGEDRAQIAIRWERGDETSVWICGPANCGEMLHYQRYTRPRVTYLKLTFGTGQDRYEMHEAFDADEPESRDAVPSVTVSTAGPEPEMEVEYRLLTPRLGLMELERFLEVHPY